MIPGASAKTVPSRKHPTSQPQRQTVYSRIVSGLTALLHRRAELRVVAAWADVVSIGTLWSV